MKIKYTITIIQNEKKENWQVDTDEKALEEIKKYIKEDPGYLEGAEWNSINVERIDP